MDDMGTFFRYLRYLRVFLNEVFHIDVLNKASFQDFPQNSPPAPRFFKEGSLLRGSGYLGYVDSNQGYNLYKWVVCPLTRVINLITSY